MSRLLLVAVLCCLLVVVNADPWLILMKKECTDQQFAAVHEELLNVATDVKKFGFGSFKGFAATMPESVKDELLMKFDSIREIEPDGVVVGNTKKNEGKR